MPYVDARTRERLDIGVDFLLGSLNTVPGELNYVLTRLVAGWLRKRGLSYEGVALSTGVLENVKQELYRRLVAPYEDEKREENGDVEEYEAVDTYARQRKKTQDTDE